MYRKEVDNFMNADSLYMKEINKNTLRFQLKSMVKATKPELAEKTGLSVVTVNSLISDLVQDGEVMIGESVPSKGGRPSVQYQYNGNYKNAVIIYGHQKDNQNQLNLCVINLFGEELETKSGYFDHVTIKSFEKWLDEVTKQYPAINLIAFGLPGEEVDGVITINDYNELIGDQFLLYYKDRYQVPVIFENDVNAATYGFYTKSADSDLQKVFVGMYFPRIYNPGAGIVYNKQIYYGRNKFAGEFMSIPMRYRWTEFDYKDVAALKEMIGLSITIYCCTFAPDVITLYGDFWTKDAEEAIRDYVRVQLKGMFETKLVFQEDLLMDYVCGMKKIAVDYMENELRGARR